jgi:integrase/recombinase XerD
MSTPKVRLYIRVVLPDGTRSFLDPVFSGNQKLKEGWAILDEQPQRFDEADYYLRYLKNGKRSFESVGSDAQQALTAKRRTELRLQAAADGIEIPADEHRAGLGSVPASSRPLLDCIADYIAETKAHKSAKTLSAYSETLLTFLESADQRKDTPEERRTLEDHLENPSAHVQGMTIEGISRTDLLKYKTSLEKRGNSPRTVSNRIDYFQIFLHHFGLPSLLKGKDKPKYTAKKVRGYNGVELGKMFDQATTDEADLLHFLLCTGTREGEMRFACWSDVDLVAKTYTVTEHRQLGFIPKDKEEGTIPLPDVLVDRLIARRKRYPKTQLIFLSKENSPEGHALRIVKRLALRAGVNCGHCVNKQGKSCATHPVCYHVFLHKLRKTYATTLHNNGVSARTIMGFLRHSELNTTLRYLADGDDEQTRAKVNATFNSFGGGAA